MPILEPKCQLRRQPAFPANREQEPDPINQNMPQIAPAMAPWGQLEMAIARALFGHHAGLRIVFAAQDGDT
jgi:hypothetical protein